MSRALFLLLAAAFLAAGTGRTRADDLVVTEPIVRTVPIDIAPAGTPANSSLFRNELTQVDITDQRAAASDFDGLAKGTVTSGSGLALRQKIGDQFLLTARTQVGVARNDLGTIGGFNRSFQGQSAANQAAVNETLSSDTQWSAAWTPSDVLSFSYASSSSSQLDDEGARAQALGSDATFSATWKAGAKTTLTLSDDQQTSYDWTTLGNDAYETTAIALTQALAPGLTWTTSPGWLRDTSGGYNPYRLTGPQLSTSFDWTPAQGTKWTVGGAWNRLEETDPWSSDAVDQTTRSLFVAYDRALGKNLRLQLRGDYSNLDAPRATVANPAQQEQFSLRAGQKYNMTDTLSARVDVSQCFQQQDKQAWTKSESMATLSVQKNF